MILIQSYQELYYALKVLQILKDSEKPNDLKLHDLIKNQIDKLI
jgi:hypothetical protein